MSAALKLCQEHKLVFWVGFLRSFEGWMLAAQGHPEAAVERIESGLDAFERTSTFMFRPHSYALLAEVYASCQRLGDSLRVLRKALALADSKGEGWIVPDLHRLEGEILLQTGTDANVRNAAEASFLRALTAARVRSAKSFELRAATSLARSGATRGRCGTAYETLAPVYEWFTGDLPLATCRTPRAC